MSSSDITHKQWIARRDELVSLLDTTRKAVWAAEQQLARHDDTPCLEQQATWDALRDLLPMNKKVYGGWRPLTRYLMVKGLKNKQGFVRSVHALDTVIAWESNTGSWEVWEGSAIDLDGLLGPGPGIRRVGRATTVEGVMALVRHGTVR